MSNSAFVGRSDELAALEGAWETARAGEVAPVLVVYGEAGIGKTRMVSEFARSVQERGGEVWWGACYEGGGAGPYAVWAQAIRSLIDRTGEDGPLDALGDESRWLAPVLGDVEPGSVTVPAEVARSRLAEVVVRLLDSREATTVLVLDDMQWAHPESLALLGNVTRLAREAVLVVCCRAGALEPGHPLAQRLAEGHRQRVCEYLPLASLSRQEAGELLERVAGRPLDRALIDAVFDECGGNPFFLGELGRHLRRHGGEALVSAGDLGLPESIRGAVGLRLAGVSAQTGHVLQLASVFTSGFTFAELAALTELEEGDLLDCLEQALAEELIRPFDGERYDFAHALVRHTLSERLSPSRRARLHRRLANVLELLSGDDSSRVAGELVRQYHASATLPGAGHGAAHALTAARRARAAGVPGEAVTVLRLGLDLVGDDDSATRAELMAALAVAEAEAGLFDQARATLESAVGLLEGAGATGEAIADVVYQVGAAFAAVMSLRSVQEIRPVIARALATVGANPCLAWARLKVLAGFDQPEAFGPLRIVRPVQFDREAVRIARTEGTESDYVLTIDGWDPSFGADLDALIARIEKWHDPVARLRVLISIVGHVTLADPDGSPAVDLLCAQLGALADDLGLPPQRELVHVYQAALLGARGQFEAAAEELGQARAISEHLAERRGTRRLVTLVSELIDQHVAPEWPRLARDMWELASSPDKSGWLSLTFGAFAAQAFAIAGEAERARDVLDAILPALDSDEVLEAATTNPMGLAGGAVWELRDSELAERLLPRAKVLAGSNRRAGFMTSKDLTVARLSAVLGRFDQAAEYFDRARVTLERRDQRVLRAIVDYDEALARVTHGRPGAAGLLAAAGERFDELGMREWSRRAALVDVAEPELPDRLTVREAEILRLVARGRTNREIAAELCISVHTVERHVQNGYRKIGVRNRAEASTYVARMLL